MTFLTFIKNPIVAFSAGILIGSSVSYAYYSCTSNTSQQKNVVKKENNSDSESNDNSSNDDSENKDKSYIMNKVILV